MRQRTGSTTSARRLHSPVSPVILVGVLVIVVCVIDLSLTLADPSANRSSTAVLALPLIVDVLVLGGVALVGAWASARWQSAQLRTRASLLRSREDAARLLKVIDNTSAVIYMRDSDGRYLLVNRQYERLFGIERKDIVGLTDHDLFPKQMADDFRANDLKALAEGAPIQMEEVAPDSDGPHTYITVKYPIPDATGLPYAICGISTDITELKRAEEKVLQLNTDLEGRVRERTAELEASTHELDAFAYSVSHDLRAPLRAVAGFSEVLLEDYRDQLDETGQGYLQRVLTATERMGQLIDDLLNLSRAARVELTRRPVDVTALAHQIVAELAATDPDPGREVEVIVDDGLRTVGDPALLELVLQNLISNSWKFTAKEPHPLIHVGSTGGDDGAPTFFVSDNGAGFDMRYLDKLFVPFQRLHTVEDFAGSGIGLAIVGRIISRHAGRVWAEGAPGGGAVFYFTLPTPAKARRTEGESP
jgi:PAS domain S-box-containing protein